MAPTQAYPDSSFLFSLVARDAQTPAASAYMRRVSAPVLFNPLHRLEVRNALRNAAGRGEINAEECRAGFRQIEDDLRDGLLLHAPVNWTAALRRADELSEKYPAKDGQRTIDLLHVALALEGRATVFLSFDLRQRKLAEAAGLRVKP